MLLYIIYIESLLIQLGKSLNGFKLEAPMTGAPKHILFEATSEAMESFVDDNEIVITSDSDFHIVDKLIEDFECVSGAILNRSEKTKIMGLGEWRNREKWPLKWVKVVKVMRIFGIKVSAHFPSILDLNWEDQLRKFQSTLYCENCYHSPNFFAVTLATDK